MLERSWDRWRELSVLRSGLIPLMGCVLAASIFAGCRGKDDAGGKWPADFENYSDNAKVEYVMRQSTPDSVARFILNASIGKIPGVSIDTLAQATLYAYEHYKDEKDLQTFSNALDDYVSKVPLSDKMMIMRQAGEVDPQGLGYELGLEYVDMIRSNHKNAVEVGKEIEALRIACGEDTMMFQRFLIGFKVALDVDRDRDLPMEIYSKFKNYK